MYNHCLYRVSCGTVVIVFAPKAEKRCWTTQITERVLNCLDMTCEIIARKKNTNRLKHYRYFIQNFGNGEYRMQSAINLPER